MNTKPLYMAKNISLITETEDIAKKAKKSKLKPALFEKIKKPVKILCSFLDCSEIQAVFFAIIFSESFCRRNLEIQDIAEYVNCSSLKIVPYLKDLNDLVEKKLICKEKATRRRNIQVCDVAFYLSKEVLDAIINKNKPIFRKKEKLELMPLLEKIDQIMEERDDDEISFSEMIVEINMLLETNRNLHFIQELNKLKLAQNENLFLLYVCFETANGDPEVDLTHACNRIFNKLSDKFEMKRSIVKANSMLVTKDLIKLENGFFRSDSEVTLTDHAIDLLFGKDMGLKNEEMSKIKNMKKVEDIAVMRLYYNEKEQEQIKFFTNILKRRNLKKVQDRLKKNKMHSGFAALFYGSPGTGKTETVYQIAKSTGRGLMMVDISETKSMWYGESEKRIKEIFTDYRKAVKHSAIAPILLFNEADGVLGKRQETRGPVGQTENAIQNILLQEIEDLDGILIATTNLTDNLDKAFERRFLYKIKFEKPSAKIMAKIWRTKLPKMKGHEAGYLAKRHQLSGGQIENIARKYLMKEILHASAPDLDELEEYCIDETLHKERGRIGF